LTIDYVSPEQIERYVQAIYSANEDIKKRLAFTVRKRQEP
jgi:hypothetical protein